MEFGYLFDYTFPWLTMAILGAAAIVLGLIVQAIAFGILRRITRFSTIASCVVEYTAAPARFAIPLVALQFVIAAAPADLEYRGLATHALSVLLIVAVTWVVLRMVKGVGEAVIRLHPVTSTDNLQARRIHTQARVLTRTVMFFVLLIGTASALMTFPGARQIGTSLLASAGVVGLVAGIAARPVVGNLIAGLQIALTQPIRLDDVVIINGEWGRIEEITATYVVVKIWDERRLIVPLDWVVQNPFQNWTRTGSQLLGTVFLWVDYRVPLAPLRAELERLCKEDPAWDGRVAGMLVTDTSERSIQVRALVSAADASSTWDLRCRVREGLISFLQREYPDALPRMRAEIEQPAERQLEAPPSSPPVRPGKGDSTAIREPTNPEVKATGDERAPAEAQDGTTTKGA